MGSSVVWCVVLPPVAGEVVMLVVGRDSFTVVACVTTAGSDSPALQAVSASAAAQGRCWQKREIAQVEACQRGQGGAGALVSLSHFYGVYCGFVGM